MRECTSDFCPDHPRGVHCHVDGVAVYEENFVLDGVVECATGGPIADIESEIASVRARIIGQLAETCLIDTNVDRAGVPDYVDYYVMPEIRALVTSLTGYASPS